MASFLTKVQSHFKNKDTGRYIGIILAEVVQRNPSVLQELFPTQGRELAARVNRGELMPQAEWRFSVSKKVRVADLAILDSKGNCFGLLEIKVEDKERPGQFDDYCTYAEERASELGVSIPFTVLCKYLKPELSERNGQATLSLAAFCRALSKGNSAADPAVVMWIEYVKDMGIMFTDIAEADIRMLLRRFFHDRKGGGRIAAKENISVRIPGAFSAVIGNQFAVSELMRERLGNYRAVVDFQIEPFSSGDEGDGFIRKSGGYMETFTSVPLITAKAGVNDWLYLSYGLNYSLNKKGRPVVAAFSKLDGNRLPVELREGDSELYEESSDHSFGKDNLQERLSASIHACVREVVAQAINSKAVPPQYRMVIRDVKKAME